VTLSPADFVTLQYELAAVGLLQLRAAGAGRRTE